MDLARLKPENSSDGPEYVWPFSGQRASKKFLKNPKYYCFQKEKKLRIYFFLVSFQEKQN